MTDPASQGPTSPTNEGATRATAPASPGAGDTIPPSIAAPPPRTLGRYTIKRVLGEGGMGTVYLAEQENPRREVALKVIRAGYLAPELLRRFELESQVLGRLQHPGIAQIYEAGVFHDDTSHADVESSSRRASSSPSVTSSLRHSVTSSPIPFFAMEFIRGVPLTDYADSKKLNTRHRLELLAKVCDAVYHAHQKGVIHRDLKPGNILVVDDSPSSHSITPSLRHSVTSPVGQPKILDFGVARATDSDIQQTTMQTDVGQLIGTVPYMSPEQVTGDPSELDTRSDVYALGVIAYELLAGRLPHDLRRKMIHEAARIIREEEPTRLSSINRTLRGDVETIVAKALEKEKTRRYQSAESLASDIRRYLKDEPIAARPASTWYQASKFAKRNKGLVTGLAAAFVLLIAGVIGTSIGLGQAVRARDAEALARREADTQRDAAVLAKAQEEQQRKVAEAQRDKAEKIAEFMSDTLKGAGPSVALGRDITMLKEMMDAAAARIEKGDLSAAPEAELRLRDTIGNTYRELAVFDAALAILEPALALARSTHAGDYPATATALGSLASLHVDRGDLAEAEAFARESLDMFKRLAPGDHPDVAVGLLDLGLVIQARGDLAGAEALFREALDMDLRLFPGDHEAVAGALGNLATALLNQGDLAAAETYFRRSLEMSERLFPGDHPNIATELNNLASVLRRRGDLAGAELFSRRCLEINRHLLRGDHPTLAVALTNLSGILVARGDLAGAEPFARESADMFRRLFAGDHPSVAVAVLNLAGVLQQLGDLEQAEPLAREAVGMFRRLFPDDHPTAATALVHLASLLRARGDWTEAESLYRESLEMNRRLFPGDHPSVADSLSELGAMLYDRGDYAAAEPLFRESLDMNRRLFPGDHPDVAEGLNNLANVLLGRGDAAGAEPLSRESLEMRRRIYPGDHPAVAVGLNNLGGVIRARGDLAAAAPICAEALAMTRRLLPGDHSDVALCLSNLGVVLLNQGDLARAEPLLREALEMRKRVLRDDHPDTLDSLSRLAELLIKSDRYAEAAPLVEACVEGRTKKLGVAHALTRKTIELAVSLYAAWDKADPGKGHEAEAAAWKARLDADSPPAPSKDEPDRSPSPGGG